MQTALILMTILGCDDSATQCHYVEMLDQRWATIQECDASSEEKLQLYSNINYPVVVAVCQTPEDSGVAEHGGEPVHVPSTATESASRSGASPEIPRPKADIPEPVIAAAAASGSPADAHAEAGIAARAFTRFKDALPEADTLKAIVAEPVHVVTDSYSWVARRF
ncbi:MAG: hypothetical protein KUA43_11165 [Hoeflea sp.]|uniref:hypothetical protein n=1 Tax=Hoeflea sp. TaxID=1940281 RepID=UPI001DC5391F|nr:hypothetical protein [Hoeflea sp.]MBU4529664.1 hypothetical protein [Alphaproteobacteria bacterium]MBU4546783.1 hypothetical protein [Alphaproteobacteria bacterium]MBU4551051.1 hypothetical protein [Alphaproteobacteria bacterium]MBV1723993.1 hypothetical protein [Hoeflea sp.]MBV1763270.1 hypothetical protein [Hoeflea sp.]